MAKRYSFSYPYAAYMDVSLMRESKKRTELVREYNAMRAEIGRRLKRLEKYKWTRESSAYQYNVNRYKSPSHMNKREIAKLMRDAAQFLAAETSTVEGQRRQRDKALETWREQFGLTFLNKRNYRDWGFFVGAARNALGKQYVSSDIPEMEALFRIARRDNINIADRFGGKEAGVKFREWMDKATLDPKYETYLNKARAAQDAWSSEDYDRNPF